MNDLPPVFSLDLRQLRNVRLAIIQDLLDEARLTATILSTVALPTPQILTQEHLQELSRDPGQPIPMAAAGWAGAACCCSNTSPSGRWLTLFAGWRPVHRPLIPGWSAQACRRLVFLLWAAARAEQARP